MTRLGLSQTRDALSELTNRVAYGGERVVVQRHGKDIVALVSMEDLALLEALEEQRDMAAIQAAWAEQGDEPPEPWHAVKAELGLK